MGLLATSIVLGPALLTGAPAANFFEADPPRHLWTFRLPDKGAIDSTPLVAGRRVYVGAAHDSAFSPYGAVYCLDRETGEVLWTFHDGKKMKPVYSSPVLVDGRLYVGEGYHQDQFCKIYCLDPEKGEKVWEFGTYSHTESTPAVVGDRLYSGAGDDGLYCLSADKGEKVWQFPSFHIDAPPQVAQGRVYAGCGIGDLYKTPALLCLAADSGHLHWRVDTKYPVWGRPAVGEGRVYYATGNGRLNESVSEGGGSVGCVRAQDGQEVWTCKLPDAVLGQVALSKGHLLAGCRDGYLYCLDRLSGQPVWKKRLSSPIVTAPAVIQGKAEFLPALVSVLGREGQLQALAPAGLRTLWQLELGAGTGLPVESHSSPVVTSERDAAGKECRRIYAAVTLISTARIGELHCYLDDNIVPVD
jgi:outer membrane protein assembly factor BamB